MTTRVTAVARWYFAALRQIRSVRRALDHDICLILAMIRAVVVSKIIYQPLFLDNIILSMPQSVLNAPVAQRLVHSAGKSDHISPLLHESSTGCGSRSRSGSGYAFWCTVSTALRRHISPTASVEPPMLTVVVVYALPSRTRWS